MLGAMRHAILLPLSVALGVATLIVVEVRPDRSLSNLESMSQDGVVGPVSQPVGGVASFAAYVDPDLAFEMAVPAGWTPIVTVTEAPRDVPDPVAAMVETGHVVGFEAPRDGPDDVFADYVMIEILPGTESGLFHTDGTLTREISIDGRAGLRDSLRIDDHRIGQASLDLVVHQAEVRGTGWTIGFYAIGEPAQARLLEEAFELMIRTFHLPGPPFRVSGGRAASGRIASQRVG